MLLVRGRGSWVVGVCYLKHSPHNWPLQDAYFMNQARKKILFASFYLRDRDGEIQVLHNINELINNPGSASLSCNQLLRLWFQLKHQHHWVMSVVWYVCLCCCVSGIRNYILNTIWWRVKVSGQQMSKPMFDCIKDATKNVLSEKYKLLTVVAVLSDTENLTHVAFHAWCMFLFNSKLFQNFIKHLR